MAGKGSWLRVACGVFLVTLPSALDLERESRAEVVEEVIVTARKVAEPVQEVPASLQVLSGDLLDQADLSRLYELQFAVPGLVVQNVGMFGARFALRGVADQGGDSLAIANHLNGAYLGSANLAIARSFDMQRVEVLKGPQGTLYGRNATGGSINFVTRPADADFDAELEAAYGSFDTARLQGYVNVPLDESAGLRLAFIGSEGDGYIGNTLDQREFGEADFWGIRASLTFDVTEALRADVMVQRVVDDGAAGDLWTPNLAYLPDPDDIQRTRVTLENPYLDTENDFAILNLEYQFESAALYSVSAYARSDVRDVDDCAGIPPLTGCVRGVTPLQFDQWSQELRLASTDLSAVEWLVGLYWLNSRHDQDFFLYAPVLNAEPLNDNSASNEETAYAAFGQLVVPLGERVRLSAGIRYSSEESRVAEVGTGVLDNVEPLEANDHWSDTSWRLGLELPTEDLLLYASAATGFRSGGITTDVLPSGDFAGYDPENVLAYELGVRSSSDTGSWNLHAAVFYYDFDDMQVLTTLVLSDAVVTVIDNAARAEIYGLDTSGSLALGDSFSVSGGLVWLPKREFVDFETATTGDVSGNDIARAPEWTTTTSVDYTLPVSDLGRLTATLQYQYRSSFYFTKENLRTERQESFGLVGVSVRFEASSERWYLFAAGRNLTDEDYFHQAFIQSSPGYPLTWEAGLGLRF